MASLHPDLDPNDPINILLMPFDPIPRAAAAASTAPTGADTNADAEASQAALQAAAAAEEAERQRKLAEEKANALRTQTVGGKGNITQFGGAEGEVVYESNVRPSGRRWEPSNRVEVKRTVVDFQVSDPLLPSQMSPDRDAAPSVFSPASNPSPVSFSQPIRVEMASPVAAAVISRPQQQQQQQQPKPKPAAAPAATAPAAAAPAFAPAAGAPAVFSPTAGVHPTTSNNKTEELMKKVEGGNGKVRQCPSFRMLEFQIQYEDYKQTKTAVS